MGRIQAVIKPSPSGEGSSCRETLCVRPRILLRWFAGKQDGTRLSSSVPKTSAGGSATCASLFDKLKDFQNLTAVFSAKLKTPRPTGKTGRCDDSQRGSAPLLNSPKGFARQAKSLYPPPFSQQKPTGRNPPFRWSDPSRNGRTPTVAPLTGRKSRHTAGSTRRLESSPLTLP